MRKLNFRSKYNDLRQNDLCQNYQKNFLQNLKIMRKRLTRKR